jgi:hypothetical protein
MPLSIPFAKASIPIRVRGKGAEHGQKYAKRADQRSTPEADTGYRRLQITDQTWLPALYGENPPGARSA